MVTVETSKNGPPPKKKGTPPFLLSLAWGAFFGGGGPFSEVSTVTTYVEPFWPFCTRFYIVSTEFSGLRDVVPPKREIGVVPPKREIGVVPPKCEIGVNSPALQPTPQEWVIKDTFLLLQSIELGAAYAPKHSEKPIPHCPMMSRL